jgi:flagellar protein FlaF
MYRSSYNEMAAAAGNTIRANERLAFDKSIDLLRLARERGRGSRESVEALLFTSRLWCILLDDLADEGNGFPDSLKAELISIGIWILRRTEDVRSGKIEDFSALIEVSESIRKGLESR